MSAPPGVLTAPPSPPPKEKKPKKNPLHDDFVLHKYLEALEKIRDVEELKTWRQSFLERYTEFFLKKSSEDEQDNEENREEEEEGLRAALEAYQTMTVEYLEPFAELLWKLHQLVEAGELSTEVCTANARQCLSALQMATTRLIDQIASLCPSTEAHESIHGYRKVELGAVMIHDGFHQYLALEAAQTLLRQLREGGPVEEVADRHILEEMDRFQRKLQVLKEDSLTDMGLFRVMEKCKEFDLGPVPPADEPPPPPPAAAAPPPPTQPRKSPYAISWKSPYSIKWNGDESMKLDDSVRMDDSIRMDEIAEEHGDEDTDGEETDTPSMAPSMAMSSITEPPSYASYNLESGSDEMPSYAFESSLDDMPSFAMDSSVDMPSVAVDEDQEESSSDEEEDEDLLMEQEQGQPDEYEEEDEAEDEATSSSDNGENIDHNRNTVRTSHTSIPREGDSESKYNQQVDDHALEHTETSSPEQQTGFENLSYYPESPNPGKGTAVFEDDDEEDLVPSPPYSPLSPARSYADPPSIVGESPKRLDVNINNAASTKAASEEPNSAHDRSASEEDPPSVVMSDPEKADPSDTEGEEEEDEEESEDGKNDELLAEYYEGELIEEAEEETPQSSPGTSSSESDGEMQSQSDSENKAAPAAPETNGEAPSGDNKQRGLENAETQRGQGQNQSPSSSSAAQLHRPVHRKSRSRSPGEDNRQAAEAMLPPTSPSREDARRRRRSKSRSRSRSSERDAGNQHPPLPARRPSRSRSQAKGNSNDRSPTRRRGANKIESPPPPPPPPPPQPTVEATPRHRNGISNHKTSREQRNLPVAQVEIFSSATDEETNPRHSPVASAGQNGRYDSRKEYYTAAVVRSAGGPIQLEQRPIPVPGRGQVLVKVLACGVCRSDDLTIQGDFPGCSFPRVPGHEVTGRVVALGPNVDWPPVNMLVGIGWHGGHCLVCKNCRRGNFTMCLNCTVTGIHLDGGYQEYCIAHWTSLIELPKRFDPVRDAPLLGAAVLIFQGLQKATDARPGDVVAIQGIGGIGHIGIQFARRMGFRVVAISNTRDKEQTALKLGAHVFIDMKSQKTARKLQKLGGAKLIIATAPETKVVEELFPGLGLNGRLLVAGMDREKFALSPNQLIFSHAQVFGLTPGAPYEAEEACDFAVLQDVECLTEIYPLERAQEAFDRMLSGKARHRVVLEMPAR